MSGTDLKQPVYLYDPDNLPGMHELGQSPQDALTNPTKPMLIPFHTLEINRDTYCVPLAYLKPEDFILVEGVKATDL